MSRPRGLPGIALALATFIAAGCAGSVPCPERLPLRIQFLLVNDVYQLEPDSSGRGGLARVATLVERLRGEAEHTMFVLAGDTLSPSPLSALLRGSQMVEAWNAAGLDAATFGNHEFDWGPDLLRARMAESHFVWFSSNVWEAHPRRPFGGVSRALRRDWSGIRVGVVGLTTVDTATGSKPGPDVSFESPIAAAQSAFAELGPVDLRVAVTHLPLRVDRELSRAVALDVILGGHDHQPIVTEDRKTAIIKAGSDAVNVGRVEFELGCHAAILSRRVRLMPVDGSIPESPMMAALVARFAALAARELDADVGRSQIALDGRELVIRRQETGFGGFLAGVMKDRVRAELAVLNSGAIRGNRLIPAGPLTRRDLYQSLPFGNVIVLVELHGAALKAALEHSVDALPAPAGRFLQTAGIEYVVHSDQPVGQRVSDIRVEGRPWASDTLYRAAMTDYLAHGQDGYAMFAGARLLVGYEDGPGLLESVLEAFAAGRSP
jgi:5'-nucleotidase